MAFSLMHRRQQFLSYLIPEQTLSLPSLEKPVKFRKKYQKSFKRQLISEKYNHGKAYISNGKEKKDRTFAFTECSCGKKCWLKFERIALFKVFDEFWGMGSLEKRRECIIRWCSKNEEFGRSKYLYSLPQGWKTTRVCRQFFCQTLCVTFKFIFWTLNKKISENRTHCLPDNRCGKHRGLSSEQFSEMMTSFAGEQIQPSHYGRANSSKLYFEASKSYRFFYSKYISIESNVKKASYTTFVAVVKAALPDISFKRKSRDKCDKCRHFETSSIEVRAKLENDYLNHLERKDGARKAKANDMSVAREQLSRGEERNFMALEVCYPYFYFPL